MNNTNPVSNEIYIPNDFNTNFSSNDSYIIIEKKVKQTLFEKRSSHTSKIKIGLNWLILHFTTLKVSGKKIDGDACFLNFPNITGLLMNVNSEYCRTELSLLKIQVLLQCQMLSKNMILRLFERQTHNNIKNLYETDWKMLSVKLTSLSLRKKYFRPTTRRKRNMKTRKQRSKRQLPKSLTFKVSKRVIKIIAMT